MLDDPDGEVEEFCMVEDDPDDAVEELTIVDDDPDGTVWLELESVEEVLLEPVLDDTVIVEVLTVVPLDADVEEMGLVDDELSWLELLETDDDFEIEEDFEDVLPILVVFEDDTLEDAVGVDLVELDEACEVWEDDDLETDEDPEDTLPVLDDFDDDTLVDTVGVDLIELGEVCEEREDDSEVEDDFEDMLPVLEDVDTTGVDLVELVELCEDLEDFSELDFGGYP